MSEIYQCPICKQIHPDGGDCYSDAINRIKQLEEKYNDLIKINDVAMEMIVDLRGQVKMLEGKDG